MNQVLCLHNLGSLRFHQASRQQQAEAHASGTAPWVPTSPLTAQIMKSSAGKLGETVGRGYLFCGDDLLHSIANIIFCCCRKRFPLPVAGPGRRLGCLVGMARWSYNETLHCWDPAFRCVSKRLTRHQLILVRPSAMCINQTVHN